MGGNYNKFMHVGSTKLIRYILNVMQVLNSFSFTLFNLLQ